MDYLYEYISEKLLKFAVVPHAGTWIEIPLEQKSMYTVKSFPTRERGLKLHKRYVKRTHPVVVPHAGTWIEINIENDNRNLTDVVPHAGTWIEIAGNP